MNTIGELIEELKKFDPRATVLVHCHGCCPNGHDIIEVRKANPREPVDPRTLDGQADVIIEV
jgi:hypothetical protein